MIVRLVSVDWCGAVAESELSGQPINWKAVAFTGDKRNIRHAKNRLFYNDAEELSNAEYEEQTRKLVRKHWRKIESVAKALVRRKTLLRSDFLSVLQSLKLQSLKPLVPSKPEDMLKRANKASECL